jgi:hypothetical protein
VAAPVVLEMVFQLFSLFLGQAFPVLAMSIPVATATAKEDFAEQQETQGLPVIDLPSPRKQGGHQPVPQQHDQPAHDGNARDRDEHYRKTTVPASKPITKKYP